MKQTEDGGTFVLADLLDPGQRVHLHQGVGDADDVHHVHHALKDRRRTNIYRATFLSSVLNAEYMQGFSYSQDGVPQPHVLLEV